MSKSRNSGKSKRQKRVAAKARARKSNENRNRLDAENDISEINFFRILFILFSLSMIIYGLYKFLTNSNDSMLIASIAVFSVLSGAVLCLYGLFGNKEIVSSIVKNHRGHSGGIFIMSVIYGITKVVRKLRHRM